MASQTPLFPIYLQFLLAGRSPSHAPPLHGGALLRKATRHRKVKMDAFIPIPAYFRIALERWFFKKAKIPRSKNNFCGTTQKPLWGWAQNIMLGRKSVSSCHDDSRKYKSSSFPNKYFLKTNPRWPQLFNAVVNFQNTWWEHRFWIELMTTGATNSTPLLYTPNQGAAERKPL